MARYNQDDAITALVEREKRKAVARFKGILFRTIRGSSKNLPNTPAALADAITELCETIE